MPQEPVEATAVTGSRLLVEAERVEFDFATAAEPVRVSLPKSQLLALMSYAGQLNRQPRPREGEFVEVRAFPASHFTVSGTEAGEILLTLQANDGGEFAFLFNGDLVRQLQEVLAVAVKANG